MTLPPSLRRPLRRLPALGALALLLLVGGCGGEAEDPRLAEGFELVKQNRVDEAIALINAVLVEDSGNARALNLLGLALYKSGDVEGSINQYRKALEILPDYPEAHFNLGNSLTLLERPAEAEEHFRASLRSEKKWEQRKNVVVAHYNLGKCYQNSGRTEPALAEYRKCVDRDDQFYLAWFDIGKILYDSGDFDGAVGAFARYLELDPVRKEVHVFLGNSHLQSSAAGAFASAEKAFRAAVSLDDSYLDAIYSLGVSLALQQKRDEAAEQFTRAYRMTADDPQGRIHQQVTAWFSEAGRPLPSLDEEGEAGSISG